MGGGLPADPGDCPCLQHHRRDRRQHPFCTCRLGVLATSSAFADGICPARLLRRAGAAETGRVLNDIGLHVVGVCNRAFSPSG